MDSVVSGCLQLQCACTYDDITLSRGVIQFGTIISLLIKDGDFDLHCASFCAALCICQYNSFKQHKMNQFFRKKKQQKTTTHTHNNEQKVR